MLEPPQVQPTTTAAPSSVAQPAGATTLSTSIAQFSTLSSTTNTLASVAVAPQPQPIVVDTSAAVLSTPVTAALTTAPTAAPTTAPTATSASPVVVAPPPQSELASSSDTAVLPETSKTGVLGSETTSTSTKVPGSAEATPSGVAAVPVSGNDGNSSHTSRSAAVAGGIIGGLALAALLVALIWFWRRKMQRRRSTLLTPLSPLSVTQSIGREENGAYIIQRDSIGPTSFSTKVKASVMAQYNRVRGIRNPSASPYRDGSDMTIKDRIGKVWASFGGPRNRGPRWSEKKNDAFSARGIGGSLKEKDVPRSVPLAYKPGLLTGGGDLDSEAQRRRLSRTRGASVGTTLGGLDFNFGGDPFSDVHATPHPSAKPPPLFATGANNPFSDSNAIGAEAYMPKPSSYVAEIRHSRGQSVDSTLTPNRNTHLRVVGGMSRPSSGSTAAYADSSIYLRDSTSSFDTRRNKFRSDPFDLEPLSRTVAGSDGVPTALTSDLHRMPSTNSERYRQGVGTADGGLPAAHASYNSLHSSRYTSGVSEGSMNEWAAPGSDLGPRAL